MDAAPATATNPSGGQSVKLAAAGVSAVVLLVVLVSSAVTIVLGGGPALTGCSTSIGAAVGDALPLDDEQTLNARTVIDAAAQLGMPARAAVIGIATAWQESGLRNLDHGDRDSIGLFQQRPSAGWGGTPADRADHRTARQRLLDPVYAATAFYTALRTVPGWQAMPLTEAAQAVQRSAHPDAYARWEAPAAHVVATLTAQACLAEVLGTDAAARTAVDYARAQLGLPYQWGGDGPAGGDPGFDCSGLTRAAYAAAGVTLPRTAQAQYDAGPRLPPGTPLQPGDLVFYGSPQHVHHVGLYIGGNQMIDAPRRGSNVRVEDYRWVDYFAVTRPSERR